MAGVETRLARKHGKQTRQTAVGKLVAREREKKIERAFQETTAHG
jgi:hypothetical protein